MNSNGCTVRESCCIYGSKVCLCLTKQLLVQSGDLFGYIEASEIISEQKLFVDKIVLR